MWTRRICCATLLLLLASLATAQVPCSPTLLPSPTLFVNWSQYGYDAAHTGCNPYETILSPSTVGNLTLKWAFEAGVAGVPSSPAVANGMAYFASVTKTLTAVNAATGVQLLAVPAAQFGLAFPGHCEWNRLYRCRQHRWPEFLRPECKQRDGYLDTTGGRRPYDITGCGQ